MNALQFCRWQFLHKESLEQTFFKRSAILDGKRLFCVFDQRQRTMIIFKLIEKRKMDFLLVLIKLFR